MTKEALEVYKLCTVYGNSIKLPPTKLDEKVFKQVKRDIMKAGGKWSTRFGSYQFEMTPEYVSGVLDSLRNGIITNFNKENQFYYTTKEAYNFAIAKIKLVDGMRILEPSAGRGHVVDMLILTMISAGVTGCTIDCIEKNEENRRILEQNKYAKIIGNDIFDFKSLDYDLVFMNPPYADFQDIEHIKHVYDCLPHGSKIMAYTGYEWLTSLSKKPSEFRSLLKKVDVKEHHCPRDLFRGNGSNAQTHLLEINK